MNEINLKVKSINDDAVIPQYQNPGDAGFDFHACEDAEILPNQTNVVGTGLKFAIPEGYAMKIVPRSGMSLKTPIRIANSPGTIDSGYRGEVGILVHNTSVHDIVKIEKGDRIAQGVMVEVPKANFIEVNDLSETVRGEGGFGSTGQ